jgi:hypothetical protein
MQYIFYATTPAKTPDTAPLHTNCSLTYGFITSVVFVLPKGCAGLVGAQLYKESCLVFPENQNVWFTGDDINQEFIEDIDCTDGIPYVDLVTYNSDTLYAHTIEVIFTIQQPIGQTATSGSSSGVTNNDVNPIGPSTSTYTCPDGTVVASAADCPNQPTTCPNGQHLENGICVNDVTPITSTEDIAAITEVLF